VLAVMVASVVTAASVVMVGRKKLNSTILIQSLLKETHLAQVVVAQLQL
jgi:hypothetical protein